MRMGLKLLMLGTPRKRRAQHTEGILSRFRIRTQGVPRQTPTGTHTPLLHTTIPPSNREAAKGGLIVA